MARRVRTWSGWIGAGLLAMGLAACVSSPSAPPTVSSPSAPPAVDDGLAQNAPAAAPAQNAPAAAHAKAAVDTGKSAGSPSPHPAAAKPPPAADGSSRLPDPGQPQVALAVPGNTLANPRHLMGLTGDELKALLGPPAFVRRDPPAWLWRYGTASCVLNLFLYAKAAGKPHRVSHFEFRSRTVTGVAPADCYRQLLAARQPGPSG